jgi:hypothetical protein
MTNVVQFEPYRLSMRRRKVAAACREAVARSGVLIIQDQTGRILSLVGQFSFLEDAVEYSRDGFTARIPYDEIRKVRVPAHEHYDGRPNSG